jgi:hypothetical protein
VDPTTPATDINFHEGNAVAGVAGCRYPLDGTDSTPTTLDS